MRRALAAILLLFACSSAAPVPIDINVNPRFRFVGEQSFVLKNVADARQRIFVIADASGEVEQLVWVQYEQMRSGRGGRGYDYHEDAQVSVGGLPFALNVRRYAAAPEKDSDRARVYELLAKHGLRMPAEATRVRLVYVPQDNPRSEAMIIYAERGAPERDAIVERAKSAVTIALRRA
jgi:hypothetical protein